MSVEAPNKPKLIRVVGAAIVKDGKVLCAQRGPTKTLAGYWEFPGGKIEAGETPQQALQREIEEELLCEIDVDAQVCTSDYLYDFGRVELTTFLCHLISGSPRLTEHERIAWVAPADMSQLDWAPVDRGAVERISMMELWPSSIHIHAIRRGPCTVGWKQRECPIVEHGASARASSMAY